ncbi:sensor histidine kinase [Polaribacter aestuariivivens]|uniref:histidine kinase n=1 Tax=Polaribacter aestuariivivens TaxID=2304626 RepID=A0A5S3NAZ6_9FLAO|nr:sensor histidine kinase [Polaribacter aestuariivivens]TMM32460.1 sensor histidine kinase [Polaribacter aestuariivivens]
MKPLLQIIIFVFSITIFSQENKIDSIHKIEELILDKKLDSASIYLNKVSENNYTALLEKIVNGKSLSYAEQYKFFTQVSNRQSVRFEKVSNYLNENLQEPENRKKINSDYVFLQWTHVSKLRDEVSLEKASQLQKDLENYVNSFDASNVDVQKEKIRITTHPIVMYQIQQDVKNGKKLCLESLEKAEKLGDKKLQIVFLYHLTDFLIIEGKLQEYIDVSEKSLQLENELPEHSPYYFSIIQHLIDAYIYKGDNNKRVTELLDKLYLNESTKIQTYSLYAKLISRLDNNSPLKQEILNKFEVSNVVEFVKKIEVLGKDLNPNDFFHILNEGAHALEKNEYYQEAIRYKDKALFLTRKIYSEDLSNSLADYKTEQAVKVKEQEIAYEKEKTSLYAIIAVLAIVLLLIALLVLRKIRKQSKELSQKNKIIKQTLKEKELLVKEVHHRVKNNFQIVSSLLELQSRGIEDEKAKELANEGKNRIKSMALIHQKLYQNETGLVNFDEYIQLLVKELSVMYGADNQVETSISSENMSFDVDTAIPLGLIINEIITNSYKYAFRNNKNNKLSIAINKNKDNDYQLVIEDNGPGLSNDFDIKKAKSLGLRLINRLVKQLQGSLNQTNKNGAKFEISFKDFNTRQLIN